MSSISTSLVLNFILCINIKICAFMFTLYSLYATIPMGQGKGSSGYVARSTSGGDIDALVAKYTVGVQLSCCVRKGNRN